jgi:hypothetical protein
MGWVLARYLDLWDWLLWPVRKVTVWAFDRMDRVRIWLIGDIYKVLLFGLIGLVLSPYIGVFGFAPPTSYLLLGAVILAVWLRWVQRAQTHRAIVSGIAGEFSAMLGWTSIGLILVCGIQLWLNGHPGVSPTQFAALEAQAIDATARVRKVASTQNVLIALGGLIVLAVLFRSFKPVVAFGAARKTLSAFLAIAAVLTSFTFVTAAETGARHDRIVRTIVPRLQSQVAEVVEARKETASLRWVASELAQKPRSARAQLLNEIAALDRAAGRICAEEQAAFNQAVAAQMQPDMVIYGNADAQAQSYCNVSALVGQALRPAVRASYLAADARVEAGLDEWAPDITPEKGPLANAVVHYDTPSEADISIRELKALDADVQVALTEATEARRVVRGAVVDGIAELLGPEYKGVAGKVVDAIKGVVLETLALRAEAHFTRWAGDVETPKFTEELPEARAVEEPHLMEPPRVAQADAELVSLREAHGLPIERSPAQIADDAAAAGWRALRPNGGAITAADAFLAAAAIRAGGIGGVRPGVRPGAPHAPKVRVTRIPRL